MAPVVVMRSSMERMLDTIRRRDERPEGVPPALPSRPTSRGRLPSSRRRPLLPVQLSVPPIGCETRMEKKVALVESGLSMPEWTEAEMPGLESYEEMELGLGDDTDQVLKKIAAAENARNHSPQGIIWIQKRFRGHQARCSFQELKRGVTTLQSFVRGERTRSGFEYMSKRWKAAVVVQKHAKCWIATKSFGDKRKDVILLQSVIRGLLVRTHLKVLQDSELPKPSDVGVNRDPSKNIQEIKYMDKEHPQVGPSVLAELQKRVLLSEAAVRHKEEENAILQEQLQQYETRWSEYEAKMKSMEQTWQKQLTALQANLAAAKKSLIADDSAARLGRCDDASPDHLYFDSEDAMSAETCTPDCTPVKQPQPHSSSGRTDAVSRLVEEFEQRSHAFEENAGILVEVNSGKSSSIVNLNEEFWKLKVRFDAWTKDYKVRLQETKAALRKLGNSAPKARKRWWSPSCTR